MRFHPVADIFPLLQGEEFEALSQDIVDNGLIEAIWLHPDGQIIDGRNRYKACQKVGVEPKFRTWDGKGSLVGFVLSLNLKRRHLTSGQRAVLALEVEPFFAEEAKERQKLSEGRGKKGPEFFPDLKNDQGDARDQAAIATGTNGRYVSDMKRIKRDAPVIFEQVKAGEITITEGKKKAFETDSPNIKQPMQVLVSYKEIEYYTPSQYTESAAAVLGQIDLDPASSELANKTINALHIFTEDDDGLSKEWFGNVWLNPPYGKSQGKSNQEVWANKLITEYRSGKVKAAILLTKAAFGYKWFEVLFENWPVCLATKRISFLKIDGTTDGQAKHSTAFFHFADPPLLYYFVREFRQWGCIIDQKNGIVYPQEKK